MKRLKPPEFRWKEIEDIIHQAKAELQNIRGMELMCKQMRTDIKKIEKFCKGLKSKVGSILESINEVIDREVYDD